MLKIIGIILLALLILIVVILLEIIFVPVRYRFQGFYKDSYEAKANFSWLMHLITVKILLSSDKPFSIIVRVLGIPFYNNLRRKKVKVKKDSEIREGHSKLTYEQENKEDVNITLKENDELNDIITQQTEVIQRNSNNVDYNLTKDEEMHHNTIEESAKIKIPRFSLKDFWNKMKNLWRNIRYTIKRIYGKILDIKGNINYYIDLFQKEETKNAFQKCKKRLIRIWKNLRPRYFRINLRVGQDDPACMGKILGIWGMFYPFHKGNINIEPDFEKNHFDGDFRIKGRITFFVFLWTLLIYLFDKDIKTLRHNIKREA